jgi:hypothetical protein
MKHKAGESRVSPRPIPLCSHTKRLLAYLDTPVLAVSLPPAPFIPNPCHTKDRNSVAPGKSVSSFRAVRMSLKLSSAPKAKPTRSCMKARGTLYPSSLVSPRRPLLLRRPIPGKGWYHVQHPFQYHRFSSLRIPLLCARRSPVGELGMHSFIVRAGVRHPDEAFAGTYTGDKSFSKHKSTLRHKE